MPSSKKDQKRKRELKRRRERMQREVRQSKGKGEGAGGPGGVPTPHTEFPDRPAPPKTRRKSPIDRWWDRYMDAHGQRRLEMVREKLATAQPGDEWYEALFPEAVDDLVAKLDPQQYGAFVEELEVQHPDVFAMSANWHVRTMVFKYIAENRHAELDRVIRRLADEMKEVSEPVFSIISLLRLAGEEELAQLVVDAAVPLIKNADLMGWAINEMIEWAMFPAYQRCVAAGATEEAIAETHRFLLTLDAEDGDYTRRNVRDFAIHLAGKADAAWTRDDFQGGADKIGHKVYVLLVDFRRWLSQTRGVPAIASDEIRRRIIMCIDGMECPLNAFLDGLKRSEFEPFLARQLGFMSLNHVHAPATALGMLHFYDFLAEIGLVDKTVRDRAADVCTALWKEMKRTMKEDWWSYAFLERYLPERTSAP
jgi:hypothetical protein